MAVFGATGGASKASDRCSFTKISENNKDWCNGRGKPTPLRKASGIVQKQNRISTHRRMQSKSKWDSSNAKPYKHTQTIAVRKAGEIVRFWRGWCEARLVKYFTAWALIIIGLSTE